MKRIPSLLCLSLSLQGWAAEPRTLKCDFDGENQDKVYRVMAAVGVGTTLRLPEGWKVADFVVTDPKAFHAESNGIIGIVTPLAPDKITSVSIFTENEKLFVFSVSSEPSDYTDQLVLIQSSNLQYFNQKVRSEAQRLARERIEAAETQCQANQELKAKEIRQKLLFSLNSNYQIEDR